MATPQPLPAASWNSPPPKSPAAVRRYAAGPQEVPRRSEWSPHARQATSTALLRWGTAGNDLPIGRLWAIEPWGCFFDMGMGQNQWNCNIWGNSHPSTSENIRVPGYWSIMGISWEIIDERLMKKGPIGRSSGYNMIKWGCNGNITNSK